MHGSYFEDTLNLTVFQNLVKNQQYFLIIRKFKVNMSKEVKHYVCILLNKVGHLSREWLFYLLKNKYSYVIREFHLIFLHDKLGSPYVVIY